MSLGEEDLQIKSKVGIVDTGTSVLAAPSSEALIVMTKLSSHSNCQVVQGTFTCKCRSLSEFPNITFHISEEHFYVEPKDYLMPNGKGECMLLVTLLNEFQGL